MPGFCLDHISGPSTVPGWCLHHTARLLFTPHATPVGSALRLHLVTDFFPLPLPFSNLQFRYVSRSISLFGDSLFSIPRPIHIRSSPFPHLIRYVYPHLPICSFVVVGTIRVPIGDHSSGDHYDSLLLFDHSCRCCCCCWCWSFHTLLRYIWWLFYVVEAIHCCYIWFHSLFPLFRCSVVVHSLMLRSFLTTLLLLIRSYIPRSLTDRLPISFVVPHHVVDLIDSIYRRFHSFTCSPQWSLKSFTVEPSLGTFTLFVDRSLILRLPRLPVPCRLRPHVVIICILRYVDHLNIRFVTFVYRECCSRCYIPVCCSHIPVDPILTFPDPLILDCDASVDSLHFPFFHHLMFVVHCYNYSVWSILICVAWPNESQ